MGKGMDEVVVQDRDARWDKYVQKFEFKDNSFHQVRLFGDVTVDYTHSMKTSTGKHYREYCHGWDVDKGEFYSDAKDRCPCCNLEIKGGYRYHMNLIDLEAEENKPAKPKANWSPIRYIDLPSSLFKRLKELKAVNYGVVISDASQGANVQIKYDANADAANQYSGSMDTKNVPLTDAQKSYTVIQKYPDGSSKVVKGENGLPAQFEYVKCMNSRDDMTKSLRRNGYLPTSDGEEGSSAEHSFDRGTDPMTRQQKVAQLDAEAPIETMTLELDTVFAGDEEPAPKAGAAPVAAPKEAPKEEAPSVVLEPCAECPTGFGKFANALECFTKCAVMDKCREASSFAGVDSTKKSEVVDDDDDDSV